MSRRGCEMFCFGNCDDKYEKYVMRKDQEGFEKVSLKKVGTSHNDHRKALYKIKSVSKLEAPPSLTDRSNPPAIQGEFSLVRKRAEIQK
jgi:hypothetical protein